VTDGAESADPTVIRTLAVRTDDAVTAVESNRRTGSRPGDGRGRVILRVTPPFHGRMRARLHREGTADRGGDAAAQADGSRPGGVDGDASGRGTERNATPGGETEAHDGAVRVTPASLFESVPPYPTVDATGDRLRARGAYSRERHRDRHERSVAGWRRAVRRRRASEATLETAAGPHDVTVAWLG
jgi:hypothetical protein